MGMECVRVRGSHERWIHLALPELPITLLKEGCRSSRKVSLMMLRTCQIARSRDNLSTASLFWSDRFYLCGTARISITEIQSAILFWMAIRMRKL